MVKLKFIIRSNALVLRISEGKQRYYKSVKHLLKGSPNLSKHWNEDKEKFSNYAVNFSENNQILKELKDDYLSLVKEHPELSAQQVAQYYSSLKSGGEPDLQKEDSDTTSSASSNLVEDFLKVVIEREKAKQGCNFENYYKLHNKCLKLFKDFPKLTFESIEYDKCVSIAKTFAQHKGYKDTAKAFRAFLGKASADVNINFNINQIGNFKFSDYNPHINEVDTKKPDVLTPEQLKVFLNVDLAKLTPKYEDRKEVELYYDFCVFMFNSFFSPCDVIKLKYKDINKQNMIHVKRKKTHKPVELPMNPVMQRIIDKYRGHTKNGYVFPIMDDEKEMKYNTKDYLFKKFREDLNIWLKFVGKELKVEHKLYAYVFRHTAITVALDNGVPISYVAMAAGTSIDMIQKHYYNGSNSKNIERLQQVFMGAAI